MLTKEKYILLAAGILSVMASFELIRKRRFARMLIQGGAFLAMLLTGLLFVLNFKFPKPNNKQLTVLIIVVAAVVLYLLFCFNWKEYYGWNLSDLMFWKHKKG